jgi:hypothetical protein
MRGTDRWTFGDYLVLLRGGIERIRLLFSMMALK